MGEQNKLTNKENAFESAYPEDGPEFVGNMFDVFSAGYDAGMKDMGKNRDNLFEKTASLREELDQVKRELDHQNAENTVLKQRHERELEAVKRKHWKEGGITLIESVVYEKTLSELEAVKKERVEWINEGQKVMLQRDEVTRQRDEAVDIASELLSQLKYVQEKFIQTGSTPGVITQCETRLSRLSSGETKPVSPFISVEERLPEPYVEVYAGSFDDDGDFGQTICWHTGDAWEGIEITVDTMITHWAEKLPAPPQTLTEKKPRVKHDWIGRTNYCSRCGEYQTKYNKEDYCLTDKTSL